MTTLHTPRRQGDGRESVMVRQWHEGLLQDVWCSCPQNVGRYACGYLTVAEPDALSSDDAERSIMTLRGGVLYRLGKCHHMVPGKC